AAAVVFVLSAPRDTPPQKDAAAPRSAVPDRPDPTPPAPAPDPAKQPKTTPESKEPRPRTGTLAVALLRDELYPADCRVYVDSKLLVARPAPQLRGDPNSSSEGTTDYRLGPNDLLVRTDKYGGIVLRWQARLREECLNFAV